MTMLEVGGGNEAKDATNGSNGATGTVPLGGRKEGCSYTRGSKQGEQRGRERGRGRRGRRNEARRGNNNNIDKAVEPVFWILGGWTEVAGRGPLGGLIGSRQQVPAAEVGLLRLIGHSLVHPTLILFRRYLEVLEYTASMHLPWISEGQLLYQHEYILIDECSI